MSIHKYRDVQALHVSVSIFIIQSIMHCENMSVQYESISKSGKNDIFRRKNVTFFLIFAQNIDCGDTLEQPR